MPAWYFSYETDRDGRVILQGLSPEETFEYEVLVNQLDDFRIPADQARLEELSGKHCKSFRERAPRDLPQNSAVKAGEG
jgi:hypothetical protein